MLPRLASLSRLLLVLTALALRPSHAGAAGTSPADLRLVLDEWYADYVALYPIEAAVAGDADPRYESVWPNDLTPEWRARVAATCDRYLARLDALDRSALSPSDRLSLDSLRFNLRTRRDSVRQFFHLMPVNQFSCPTLGFALFGSGNYIHPFKTPDDYRHFLARARGFSAWVDTAIANLREGQAKGFTQPRILIERTLPQLADLMADDPEKNVFFGPLKSLPSGLEPAARDALRAEYEAGIRQVILPAYRRLHDFLRDEHLPHCRPSAGIGALPGGEAAYAHLIETQTTTRMSADEIHALGLREVARIRGEIEKVKAQVGFAGTVPEFLADVATSPRFTPFRTADEVLAANRAIEARVNRRIPDLFRQVPKTKFEIRPTEAFRAATASAEYSPGSLDGSRPGIFYVPIPDPGKYRVSRMEDLFLHEAIPGHHFQLSLALENTALPRFRKVDLNNAYVEGWALYCESLGRELGVYTDPYQYLGMLLGEMHRAIRLVVDTGLHARGWTREQALAYGAENEGGTPEQQIAEMERYMANPAQALGYKIGQLKIRELRARAEQRLGRRFDVRAFHDVILTEGALPLDVLETRVNEWIAAGGK